MPAKQDVVTSSAKADGTSSGILGNIAYANSKDFSKTIYDYARRARNSTHGDAYNYVFGAANNNATFGGSQTARTFAFDIGQGADGGIESPLVKWGLAAIALLALWYVWTRIK